MNDTTVPLRRSAPFPLAKAQGIRLAAGELVRRERLDPAQALPLAITPATAGVDLAAWFEANRLLVQTLLLEHGALLFRGFDLRTAEDFQRLCETATPGLLPYQERSTPRSNVTSRVYTSTEYPPEHDIPMHNENAYSHTWPAKIWFFCRQPSPVGGETPLADSRAVYRAIDPAIARRFIDRQVMYVRNYREGLDLDWRTGFQTDDRARVEAYCRASGTEFEWVTPEHLRTRQVRQAITHHPVTGDAVWFNQAHLFHVSALPPLVRESLLALHGEHDLPRNAYYGDGSPIEQSALDHIHEVYRATAIAFPWQSGDAVLVDNVLTAHGRRPFSGPRSILVAMAEPSGAA